MIAARGVDVDYHRTRWPHSPRNFCSGLVSSSSSTVHAVNMDYHRKRWPYSPRVLLWAGPARRLDLPEFPARRAHPAGRCGPMEHTHAHTGAHMHTHAHTCTHMHTHAHTQIDTHTCTHTDRRTRHTQQTAHSRHSTLHTQISTHAQARATGHRHGRHTRIPLIQTKLSLCSTNRGAPAPACIPFVSWAAQRASRRARRRRCHRPTTTRCGKPGTSRSTSAWRRQAHALHAQCTTAQSHAVGRINAHMMHGPEGKHGPKD